MLSTSIDSLILNLQIRKKYKLEKIENQNSIDFVIDFVTPCQNDRNLLSFPYPSLFFLIGRN